MMNFWQRNGMARNLWILLVAVVAVTVLLPQGLRAQSADADRDAAIAAWLANDELAGLQGLSRLAHAGDPQAQVLLGLIDKQAALQGPAVLALSRADRMDLLRAPSGLSGTNWLQLAAKQGHDLAIAWLDLGRVDADLDVAARFAALDEPRAVVQTLLTLAKRREEGFAPQTMAQDWYPASLSFLSPSLTLTAARAARLHPGDPQRRFLDGAAVPETALMDWLDSAPEALHLRAACDAVCPTDSRACTRALFEAMGNYQTLLTYGSPSNALIPDAVFARSPRGQAALARRIMLMRSTRMRDAEHAKLLQISGCAADWLAAQFDAHTARKLSKPN